MDCLAWLGITETLQVFLIFCAHNRIAEAGLEGRKSINL